ncbi:homeobox-leucine zipper protein ATHB-12-like [Henckelia pumila]|uniref:homeobox-leucine zipper protein ATHB-12-like n=1 Tax=Henckelia pumila TaxID=405737 RepID=UPI003C6E9C60
MEAPAQKTKSQEKKRSKNDRRFSDEQIKSLESIFDQETKLESRKKLQLARDLGLQPRQVAIWFQNRRARWKARQIEQEYKLLKANYDHLCLQFDHLKNENQSLQRQLQELSHDVEKNLEDDDRSDHRDTGFRANIPPDGEKISKPFGKVEEKEEELVSWGEDEEAEISRLASTQTWNNICSDGLFEQSLESTQNWWENE